MTLYIDITKVEEKYQSSYTLKDRLGKLKIVSVGATSFTLSCSSNELGRSTDRSHS